MTSVQLDFRGLQCPLPVLRTNKALRSVAGGEMVEILVTDANAPKDFRSYCETAGHRFVECSEAEGVIRIRLEKKRD